MSIQPKGPSVEERTSAHSDPVPSDPFARNTPFSLKQILVPIDFSDCSLRALELALTIALPFGAKLILLHVVEPAVYQQGYTGITPPLEETHQNLLQTGRERLALLGRKRVGHRLRAEPLVRIGRAHSEIADTAKALSVDLIVIGTHGYTGLKHVLLGSTTERVVHQAPCPVLTVRLPGAPRLG